MPLTSWGWDARPRSRPRRVAEGDELALTLRVAIIEGRQRVVVDVP